MQLKMHLGKTNQEANTNRSKYFGIFPELCSVFVVMNQEIGSFFLGNCHSTLDTTAKIAYNSSNETERYSSVR